MPSPAKYGRPRRADHGPKVPRAREFRPYGDDPSQDNAGAMSPLLAPGPRDVRSGDHARLLSRLRGSWAVQVVRLVLSRSPQCRSSDRAEVAALLAAVLLCVAALPLAGLVRAEVRDLSLVAADSQAGDRQPVAATVVGDPVTTGPVAGNASTTAEVAWIRPNGHGARADVPVPMTAVSGSEVTVWTDADGDLTDPPLAPSQVDARAGVAAAAVQLAAMALVWIALLGVRRAINLRRYHRWDAEWLSIGRTYAP